MLSSTYVQCSMLMVVIDCLLTCIRTYLRRSEQRIDKGSINRSIDRATMPRRTSVKEQSFLNFNKRERVREREREIKRRTKIDETVDS